MEKLEEWDPRPSVIRWLNQKEHRKKTVEKVKTQRWFKGVFKEAKQERDESDDEEDEVKNAVNEQSKEGKNKCKSSRDLEFLNLRSNWKSKYCVFSISGRRKRHEQKSIKANHEA